MNLKGIYRNKSESTKLFFFVMIVFISSLIGVLSIGIIFANEGELKLTQENMQTYMLAIFEMNTFSIPNAPLSNLNRTFLQCLII